MREIDGKEIDDKGTGHETIHDEESLPLALLISSAILFVIAFTLEHISHLFTKSFSINIFSLSFTPEKALSLFLYFLSYLIVAKSVITEGVHNLFTSKLLDEHFLMSVASIGALCMGDAGEAVAVMLFYQIGEAFESHALHTSEVSIKSLLSLSPETVRKVIRTESGNEETLEINVDDARVGDTLIVLSGERIGTDGVVIRGKSFLDNSSLTGESIPVEVSAGSKVYSGTLNMGGIIYIEVKKKSADSTARRIQKLTEESLEKKANAEKFITRFSKVYTPIVCILSLLVALVSFALFKLPEKESIHRALTLLVISCPCALVISIPLTFSCAVGVAGKIGVLVKSAIAIENLSEASTVVFDKTGTLTMGVFEVSSVHLAKSAISETDLVALAAHAEAISTHPTALSLKNFHRCPKCFRDGKIQNMTRFITNSEEVSGMGIKVTLEGKRVLVGNAKLMEKEQVKISSTNADFSSYRCERDDYGTSIHVAVEGEYLGHIIIRDKTKSTSKDAITSLSRFGVRNTLMLTGDNERAARVVASEVGIRECYASLSPEDKMAHLRELKETLEKKKEKLVFVGDGTNDSPALSLSDVGIAMGGLGSDAAIEASDVVIMEDDLMKLPIIFQLAKKAMHTVHENIVFSLSVKVGILILSALGIGGMYLAVFGDTGVAFLAILNSLRVSTRKVKQRERKN